MINFMCKDRQDIIRTLSPQGRQDVLIAWGLFRIVERLWKRVNPEDLGAEGPPTEEVAQYLKYDEAAEKKWHSLSAEEKDVYLKVFPLGK